MTFTEAAAEVLRIAGKPLHYKEITELAIEKNLLSHVGKSPEVTMGARLEALLKAADVPRSLAEEGVTEEAVPALAEEAAAQWTAHFNPRSITAPDFAALYRAALLA